MHPEDTLNKAKAIIEVEERKSQLETRINLAEQLGFRRGYDLASKRAKNAYATVGFLLGVILTSFAFILYIYVKL